MRIEVQNVNTNKLHDELIAAGVTPQLVESLENTTWITIDENQMEALENIVAAHDPTPTPTERTEIDLLKVRLQAAEATNAEISNTQQQLIELLIDMEVI